MRVLVLRRREPSQRHRGHRPFAQIRPRLHQPLVHEHPRLVRLERPDNLLRLPGQHAALDVGEVKRLGSRPRRVRQRPRRDALPLVPQRGRPRVDDGRRRARDAADDDRARRASIRREVRVRAEEGETQRLRRRRLRLELQRLVVLARRLVRAELLYRRPRLHAIDRDLFLEVVERDRGFGDAEHAGADALADDFEKVDVFPAIPREDGVHALLQAALPNLHEIGVQRGSPFRSGVGHAVLGVEPPTHLRRVHDGHLVARDP
mmetsp:Transcript_9483/g.34501  ORF Transcript_9483/g.34501 Transcript_9483/m.34501 type:complete len:262 (+) Transcript_9483:1235-2020(+)